MYRPEGNTHAKTRGKKIPCKQALRGALAAGRKNEGELATTSLNLTCTVQIAYREKQLKITKDIELIQEIIRENRNVQI